MPATDRTLNTALLLLVPPGIVALAWAVYHFPVDKFGVGLITLSAVTIFFSGYLKIDLPRTKLHLTLSDALIFLSLLFYGGGLAVPLAMGEAAFSSLRLDRAKNKKHSISPRTIVMNVLIAGFSTFATAFTVEAFFGREEMILLSGDNTKLALLLATMAITQFAANTFLASAYVAARADKRMLDVWNEYCFNALTLFCSSALMAGLSAKAVLQTNMPMFALAIGFFAIIYITYKRYADDVILASDQAERSEIARAEEAEAHIVELNHYVAELRKTADELSMSRESFRHAAFHDMLTQLPNRSHILDTLGQLLKLEENASFAVILLNLNRFRTINESLGYQTGDRVIRHIAKRLQGMAPAGGIVGHFGGDDFAIILRNVSDRAAVADFADSVVSTIAEVIRFKDRQVYTSASLGIALSDPAYTRAESLLRDADIAMRQAKDRRKGFMFFDPSMHSRAVSLQQLETDLRYAIVCNELEVFYQPIVDLGKLTLHGFEALVRWNHPQKGFILPNDFIPVSEDTGLVIPMTLQILRDACTQVVKWQRSNKANKNLSVSVNLSGKHFGDPSLVPQISKIIKETQIKPGRLKLEITESAAMDDAENTIETLHKIKGTGAKISLDDFGTGYSSLSYLQRFPVDTLKIDRSFVSSMDEATENDEIVRTIMALAKSLGLNVTAEGIENVQQLTNLRRLGCEYGQGYLFSPPVPVGVVDEMIADPDRWKTLVPGAGFGSGNSESNFLQSEFTN